MKALDKQRFLDIKKHLKSFPKSHVMLAGGLALGLGALLIAFPSEEVTAKRLEIPLAITLEAPAPTPEPEAQPEIFQEELSGEWTKLTVKSGDNLSLLFRRAGLSQRDLQEFLNSNDEAKALARIYPGHTLEFLIDSEGKLLQLRHVTDRLNSRLYQRTEEGFVVEDNQRQPDVQLAYREAEIHSSLYLAAKSPAVGMDNATIDQLATIFGWDIDFAMDIRKGDTFRVLFEEKFLDGEKIGNGDILAAEFTNRGNTIRAVRYEHADGSVHYYTPEGRSMRKDFLQTPLNFRYISSNFNPRRLHPVLKTVRAHRGIDYAADRGTPVWAAGDGRVTAAGYTKANGNYIFIQHGNNIETKYLHLDKKYVKKGDRVRQKQVIGTVGSTGYATGPHLHYEFLIDGVHRNPRTIIRKLPQAKSISAEEMPRFAQQISPLLAQLEEYHQATQLALADLDSAATQAQ